MAETPSNQSAVAEGSGDYARAKHLDAALHDAAAIGDNRTVQRLLNEGADVNTQSGEYGNALQAACANGHHDLAEVLLDEGADVNAQSGKYGNALHGACAQGYEKVVKILLEELAVAEAPIMVYYDAMRVACDKGHGRIIEMLLFTFRRLGLYYAFHRMPSIATQVFQHALPVSEATLGSDHLTTLAIANDLGNTLRTERMFDSAENMLQRALSGREKTLGPDHPLTLATVNNIGLLFSDQRKFVEAEKMLDRALAARGKTLGPHHMSTLATLNNLNKISGSRSASASWPSIEPSDSLASSARNRPDFGRDALKLEDHDDDDYEEALDLVESAYNPDIHQHPAQHTLPERESEDTTSRSESFQSALTEGLSAQPYMLHTLSARLDNDPDKQGLASKLQSQAQISFDNDDYCETAMNLQSRIADTVRAIFTAPLVDSDPGESPLARSLNHLQSILSAVELLQDSCFCSGSITLFTEDRSRDMVLKAVEISISDLEILTSMVRRRLTTLKDPDDSKILAFSCELLELLGAQRPPETHVAMFQLHDSLQVLCHMLAIGLLSYVGSHCNMAESSLPEQGYLPLGDARTYDGTPLVFGQCTLKCLQTSTGGPVWAFAGRDTYSLSAGRFSLSLSLCQFIDLWGPVWAVTNPDVPGEVLAMHVDGGILVCVNDDGTILEGEVRCHWIKARFAPNLQPQKSGEGACLFSDDTDALSDLHIASFCPKSRLLVGALTRQEHAPGTVSGRTLTHAFGDLDIASTPDVGQILCCSPALPWLEQYKRCPLSFNTHIHQNHDRVQTAGTRPDCWLPETYSVGFSGGYYFALTGTRVHKRSPGVSEKDRIITQISVPTTPLISLLRRRIGVEISACSHNSQKISLWHALAVKHRQQIHGYFEMCSHGIGDPRCIIGCWRLHGIDVSAWHQKLAQDDSESTWEELIRPYLPDLVVQLSFSGLQRDGQLHCALPGSEVMILERPLPRWSSMLQDNHRAAAFVVLSPRCLTYSCEGPRGTWVSRKCQQRRRHRLSNTSRPMFSTAIFVKSQQLAGTDLLHRVHPQQGQATICPQTMARDALEISLDSEDLFIEHSLGCSGPPQLATLRRELRRAVVMSLQKVVGGWEFQRPASHREFLKGVDWEDDVVAVVVNG